MKNSAKLVEGNLLEESMNKIFNFDGHMVQKARPFHKYDINWRFKNSPVKPTTVQGNFE